MQLATELYASWIGVATGILALVTAALVLINAHKMSKVESKTDEVHILVNQRLTDTLDKVEKLEARVEALGGEKAPPQREPGSTA